MVIYVISYLMFKKPVFTGFFNRYLLKFLNIFQFFLFLNLNYLILFLQKHHYLITIYQLVLFVLLNGRMLKRGGNISMIHSVLLKQGIYIQQRLMTLQKYPYILTLLLLKIQSVNFRLVKQIKMEQKKFSTYSIENRTITIMFFYLMLKKDLLPYVLVIMKTMNLQQDLILMVQVKINWCVLYFMPFQMVKV